MSLGPRGCVSIERGCYLEDRVARVLRRYDRVGVFANHIPTRRRCEWVGKRLYEKK